MHKDPNHPLMHVVSCGKKEFSSTGYPSLRMVGFSCSVRRLFDVCFKTANTEKKAILVTYDPNQEPGFCFEINTSHLSRQWPSSGLFFSRLWLQVISYGDNLCFPDEPKDLTVTKHKLLVPYHSASA